MSVPPRQAGVAEILRSVFSGRMLVAALMGFASGLPLLLTYARKGFKVVGFDIDPSKITMLEAGNSYIRHQFTYVADNIGHYSLGC